MESPSVGGGAACGGLAGSLCEGDHVGHLVEGRPPGYSWHCASGGGHQGAVVTQCRIKLSRPEPALLKAEVVKVVFNLSAAAALPDGYAVLFPI